jgi:adenosylhomocysteinase
MNSGSGEDCRAVGPFARPGQPKKQVYALPKRLDEKVASLDLAKIGAKLTKMTPESSKCHFVAKNGPFKA